MVGRPPRVGGCREAQGEHLVPPARGDKERMPRPDVGAENLSIPVYYDEGRVYHAATLQVGAKFNNAGRKSST
jgi:hypothetical protein